MRKSKESEAEFARKFLDNGFVMRGKYKTEYCDKARSFLAQGYSLRALAAVLGISHGTVGRWRELHPLFNLAIKQGQELSALWWEERGREMVEKMNDRVWLATMKNRFGWTDKVEHAGKQDSPITVQIVEFKEEKDGD